MKKLLAALAVVVVLVAAGGAWYVFLRPRDELALARSLMSHGDVKGARLELRNVLLSNPGNAEAHFRLGEVLLRLADPVAAERELTQARQQGWDEHAIRPKLAEALQQQGRSAEVLKSFQPDGLAPEQAAGVLVVRSGAQLSQHDAKAAEASAAQAEKLAPQDSAAALASANAAAESGDVGAEQAAVGRALAIDPHSVGALLLQAQMRTHAQDQAGALASLDAAVAAAPAMSQPLFARAQLLIAMHRYTDAAADAAALLKQDPRSPGANFLQASILAQQGKYAEANAALEAGGPALARVPRAAFLTAFVKSHLNQPEQAADAAARYLAQAPDDPAAYRLVASLALQGHRPAEAADVLNRAATLGHADATSLAMLGAAESQLGHADAALAALQRAAVLAPNDRGVLAQLAQAQLGRGDPTDAAASLEHAIDLDAQQPTDVSDRTAAPSRPAEAATKMQSEMALVLVSLQAGETDRAAAALERLRKGGAPAGTLQLLTGLVRSAQLDLPAATAAFNAALADPALSATQRESARSDLAGVLDLQGRRDEAEAQLRQVLAADPANPQALGAMQRLLIASGRVADAVKVAEQAHAAAPDNAGITAALAALYERDGHADRALALLDAAPKPPPTSQAKLVLEGARIQALLAAKQRPQAEDALRSILTERPNDLGARRALVGLLLADHDTAGAQSVIDEGLTTQPGAPVLLGLSVSTALQSGGIAAALDRADALARDPANLPAARLLRGEAYMAVKDYKHALDAYTAELRAPDAPAAVALSAAQAAQAAGQTDAAAGLLRAYLTTHPEATDVALVLSGLEIDAKRLDSAHTLLQQVLSHQPNNPAALNNMAWLEAQQHHPLTARAMAQRSWLLASTPQAADTLGWIILDNGGGTPPATDAQTALGLLRQAAAALPDDASVQYHYAVALKDAGQQQAARPILTKLVAGPAFDEQTDARKLLDSLPHT